MLEKKNAILSVASNFFKKTAFEPYFVLVLLRNFCLSFQLTRQTQTSPSSSNYKKLQKETKEQLVRINETAKYLQCETYNEFTY